MKDLEINLSGMDTGEETANPEGGEAVVESSPPGAQPLVSGEIIDVEWEQLEQLYKASEVSRELDMRLARTCVEYEKAKSQILQQMTQCQSFLFEHGTQLRNGLNIDPSLMYELKLPSQEGEKGFFIRKDS